MINQLPVPLLDLWGDSSPLFELRSAIEGDSAPSVRVWAVEALKSIKLINELESITPYFPGL